MRTEEARAQSSDASSGSLRSRLVHDKGRLNMQAASQSTSRFLSCQISRIFHEYSGGSCAESSVRTGLLDSRPKNQLLGPSLPVLLRLISTGFLFSFLGGMQNAEKSMLVTRRKVSAWLLHCSQLLCQCSRQQRLLVRSLHKATDHSQDSFQNSSLHTVEGVAWG